MPTTWTRMNSNRTIWHSSEPRRKRKRNGRMVQPSHPHDEGRRHTGGGHLQINRNIILWLTDLHNQLLQSSKFPFYTAAYYKALPYIVELRNKGDKKDVSELENCFDALYGVMLLRLQHKPISDETAKAVADITKLLAMLSDYYKQDKAGELKFE